MEKKGLKPVTKYELKKRRDAYRQYLQSPEVQIERFLDHLDEERQKFERGVDAGKNMRALARRAWNG